MINLIITGKASEYLLKIYKFMFIIEFFLVVF